MLKNAAIFIALLACASLLAGAPPAAAHAIVVSAAPPVDSVAPGPDVAVELRFNSRLDLERSRLTLVLPDGSSRPITVETTASPAVLAGKITGLAPGKYVVKWQVLAVDGHITRGEIPFSVGR